MAIKRCPKCGSDTIMAKVIYGATVQSLEDGTFKIIQQGKKFEVEPVQCMRCKTTFENGMNDLVETQVCKACGKPSLDIDENGECDICRTMKSRPELANMSTDDLIRMVLQLEKKTAVQTSPASVASPTPNTSPVEEVMNPPVEESAPVKDKTDITPTAAEKVAAAQQAIEQAHSAEPVEEPAQPKKRRVSKKKSADDTATEETATEATEETATEATETNIEESAPVAPEAPLNDVDPFSANTTGFNMFDQPVDTPVDSAPEMPMPMFEEEQAF